MTYSHEETAGHASSTADAAITANFHHGPDIALMRRVAAGDAAAQQELAERLVMRVRRAAHALMRGSVDADDAAQHALTEILRSAHGYRGRVTLERWADRITGSSVIRFARAVRRRGLAGSVPEPLVDVLPPGGDRAPRNLEECLSRLPEGPRDALLLRHAFGHSIDELAELTQVSPDTVKDRLMAARRELRKLASARVHVDSAGPRTMTSAAERWTATRDREALGDILSVAELAELGRIELEDSEVRAYVQQMRELESYLEDKRDQRLTASDRELVQRALSAVQVSSPSARMRTGEADTELASAVDPEGPGWIRLLATGLSIVMSVGAALALIYYEPRSVRRATAGVSIAVPEPRAEPALVPHVEALAVVHTAERGGRLRRAGRTLGASVLLSQGDELSAGEKPGCVIVDPRVDVCIGTNSALRLTSLSLQRTELDVRSGRATLNLGSPAQAAAWALRAGEVRAFAREGVFGLERNDDATLVRVRALRGSVIMQVGTRTLEVPEASVGVYRAHEESLEAAEMPPAQAQREWELVATGQNGSGAVQLTSAPNTAKGTSTAETETAPDSATSPALEAVQAVEAPMTARDLMQEAWALLKTERWSDAAKIYERIASEHPQSEEAHIVQVRLGDLMLERLGAPERALSAYERYLSDGGGPLAAEARLGRIAAFRRLARPDAERTAIEEFLRLDAKSPKASALKTRLHVLGAASRDAVKAATP